ncbi:MAG: transporter substrate-binding domain-containing protein [Synergistaceae bacterium]|nr:transporter substrate-binding domain-containing protein [Synergistaceae bacterium]
MKKIFVLALVLAMALCSCAYAESDMEYVKGKGVLVVGITDFQPMDYKNENGEWIGFDADLAKAFAESLGVKVEFQEIEWNNKILELNGKNIDCVWNGMTLTAEVLASMECSKPYCNNAQIVVIPAENVTKYTTLESMKDLTFAVEHGSAGDEQAKAHGFKVVEVQDQASALMEAASESSDGAIIDSLMAAAMVGPGTGYESLVYTIGLNSEEYGVGFRKGSDLVAALNAFFEAGYKDGSIQKAAETYKIQAALIK